MNLPELEYADAGRDALMKALDRAVETLEANALMCHGGGGACCCPKQPCDHICESFECVRAERAGNVAALEDIKAITDAEE